ncbi:MAG: L,D-transpeptidase family protein [Gammaproteobacteria bacterium]
MTKFCPLCLKRPTPRCRNRAWLLAGLFMLLSATARAQLFALPAPGNDIVGHVRYIKAKQSDTLLDIARRFDLGYNQIHDANPKVDMWIPGAGTRVVLPTRYILPDAPRKGIVVNIAEMRLYYYPKVKPGEIPRVETYPVSIGRQNWGTPLAATRVVAKIAGPAWYPPASIRAEHAANGDPLPRRVAPGINNPLGQFALQLGLPGYLIHGTNKDYGVGMQVSHGCIRLYPEDISQLFSHVSDGTPVRIVNQPYKVGWDNGALYLEVHPLLDGVSVAKRNNLTPVVQAVLKVSENQSRYPVNWNRVQDAGSQHLGIPVKIGPVRRLGIQDASR